MGTDAVAIGCVLRAAVDMRGGKYIAAIRYVVCPSELSDRPAA
jgi:hypothetical protein